MPPNSSRLSEKSEYFSSSPAEWRFGKLNQRSGFFVDVVVLLCACVCVCVCVCVCACLFHFVEGGREPNQTHMKDGGARKHKCKVSAALIRHDALSSADSKSWTLQRVTGRRSGGSRPSCMMKPPWNSKAMRRWAGTQVSASPRWPGTITAASYAREEERAKQQRSSINNFQTGRKKERGL